MSSPFLGEIRMFAGSRVPISWLACDGSLLQVAHYSALYSLLGTNFGGDGIDTFALPDLRGRHPIHVGDAAGWTYSVGEQGGVETVTLLQTQLPGHRHPANAAAAATSTAPTGALWAAQAASAYTAGAPTQSLAGGAIAPTGGTQPHNNMPPFVAVSYIICVGNDGVYPPRG